MCLRWVEDQDINLSNLFHDRVVNLDLKWLARKMESPIPVEAAYIHFIQMLKEQTWIKSFLSERR